MIIPEINPEHIRLIDYQRKARGFEKGFIAVKPNCSIQSFVLPLHALIQRGYAPSEVIVTTEQALSGAGYPGVASLAIQGNVIPFISGEEDKTRDEPLKVLGSLRADGTAIDNYKYMDIVLPTCTRVPVIDGHLAIVHAKFESRPPSIREAIGIWKHYEGVPQKLKLHSAPNPAIVYRSEEDRPQPRKDCNAGNGMAVSVGRVAEFGKWLRFIALSHNTVRGAAGGAILTAELLHKKGYL
jgi:aspartate-semialdehyde dehydrogenase